MVILELNNYCLSLPLHFDRPQKCYSAYHTIISHYNHYFTMDNTHCSQQSRVILIWHLFSCVLFLMCKCTMILCVLVTLKKNCVLYVGKYCTLATCLVSTCDSITSHHITFCIHHHLTYLQLFKKMYNNNLTHLPILYYSTHDKRFIMFPTFILLTSFQDTM